MSLKLPGPQFGVFKIWANLVEAAGMDGNGQGLESHLDSVPNEQSDIGKPFRLCNEMRLK